MQRVIAAIYSAAAERTYEAVVVRHAFPLLGGDLNDRVAEQGRRAVTTAAGRPILDMPVGTGYFTAAVAHAHTGLVAGVDIATGMVRQLATRAAASGASNLHAIQANAHDLPFRDGAFGAVLCTNGLQVIPDLDRTLAELERVLHPEGILFVSAITAPLTGVLPAEAATRLPALFRSARSLAAAIRVHGLEVTSIETRRLAVLLEARRAA